MIAMDLINQGLSFSYFLFLHFFRMMYWVWIPGFLFSAFFSLRYRESARSRLLSGGGLFAALLYGITSSPSRKKALGIAGELKQKGVGTAKVLAYLIASQNLVIYFLVILMAMMGAEFALGQLMGGIIMTLLVASGWRLLIGGEEFQASSVTSDKVTSQPTWSGLLLSGSGWWEALKYISREFRFFWLNLSIGILLGGLILAAGLQKWWIDFSQIGGEGILSDILTAFVAPIIGIMLFVPPVGNLPVVSNLFKTDAIGYPGVVSFVLASLLNPLILSGYARLLVFQPLPRVSLLPLYMPSLDLGQDISP
jgi:uncharacterized membrane protein YraQ (UPF0718 family)